MNSSRMALGSLLAATLLLSTPAWASPGDGTLRGGVFEAPISLSLSDISLQDAIRLVAQKGRLNIAVTEQLPEKVNLELRDVRLGDALETLLSMGGLQSFWRGNVLAVLGRRKALERGMLANSARVFKLRWASAQRVAEYLNSSTLMQPYASGKSGSGDSGVGTFELARADAMTNTLLVMGAPAEVSLAERMITALDQPTNRKVYHLSFSNAVQVASILNGSIFNTGNRVPNVAAEQVRAEVETVSDGKGSNSTSTDVQMSGENTTIRGRSLQSQMLPIEPRSAMAVPDSHTNSVIVIGTSDMLAQVEELLPQLDRKPRQVAIEVEIVETSSQDASDLGLTLGGAQNSMTGGFETSTSPSANNQPLITVGYDSAVNQAGLTFRAKLNLMIQEKRARVLAHPTVLASDNSESQINIVDEVIKGTRVSNSATSGGASGLVVIEPIYGMAGVTLNILPRVGADGSVSMRLHPSVASVRDTQRDSQNNLLSLLSRRELVAEQVTIPAGATLNLGGLTQTSHLTSRSKWPWLGDLPFLGGLFSSTNTQDVTSELMILVKPRIVEP